MNLIKVFLLTCLGLIRWVDVTEGTLAQSSNKFDNDEVSNTFAKDLDKKDVTSSSTTVSPQSTLPSKSHGLRGSHRYIQSSSILKVSAGKGNEEESSSGAVGGNGNHQKAVWITLLICLNVLLLFVIALGLRTGYACYRKFTEGQRNGSGGTNSGGGTVHFTAGGVEPRIFTVMPGHLVLQIPSGRQGQQGLQSEELYERAPDMNIPACGSSMRGESPPPPYITLYPQLKDN